MDAVLGPSVSAPPAVATKAPLQKEERWPGAASAAAQRLHDSGMSQRCVVLEEAYAGLECEYVAQHAALGRAEEAARLAEARAGAGARAGSLLEEAAAVCAAAAASAAADAGIQARASTKHAQPSSQAEQLSSRSNGSIASSAGEVRAAGEERDCKEVCRDVFTHGAMDTDRLACSDDTTYEISRRCRALRGNASPSTPPRNARKHPKQQFVPQHHPKQHQAEASRTAEKDERALALEAEARESKLSASMEVAMTRCRALTEQAEAAASEAQLWAKARTAEAESVVEQAIERAHARTSEAAMVTEAAQTSAKARAEAAEAWAELAEARACERRAAADAAGLRAEERIEEAEAEAEAAVRRAQTRAQAAEVAARGRAERADQVEPAVSWKFGSDDLPDGLAQRLLEAEIALEHSGRSEGKMAAAALRSAGELHSQLEREVRSTELQDGRPVSTVLIATWGVLMAAALNAVLLAGIPTAASLDASMQSTVNAMPATRPAATMRMPPEAGCSAALPVCSRSLADSTMLLASPPPSLAAGADVHKSFAAAPLLPRETPTSTSTPRSSRTPSHIEPPTLLSADELSTCDGGEVVGNDIFWALPPESELSLTVAEVQSSVALEYARLQDANRTLQLQLKLQRLRCGRSSSDIPQEHTRQKQKPHRMTSAVHHAEACEARGLEQTNSLTVTGICKGSGPPYAARMPMREPEDVGALDVTMSLPTGVLAHLHSSPGLTAAAQRWGHPGSRLRARSQSSLELAGHQERAAHAGRRSSSLSRGCSPIPQQRQSRNPFTPSPGIPSLHSLLATT